MAELSYKFWQKRRFSFFMGLITGAIVMLLTTQVLPKKLAKFFSAKPTQNEPFQMPMPNSEEWDPFLDDAFESQLQGPDVDPFDMLNKMRDQMMKKTHPFDSWYQRKFGGGGPEEIKRSENEYFVFYAISIKGLDKQNLSIEVKDQQIDIKGKYELKDEQGNLTNQTFVRSFPVPRNVNASKVEMENEIDKIILKFPKIKGE